MKKGGLIALTTMLVLVVGVAAFASGTAPFNFEKSDPVDTTNADYDIVSIGATPNGDYIDFWIQVRGQINIHPEENYIVAYAINIYGTQESYEIVYLAMNSSGSSISMAWFKVGDNTNFLSSGDYSISGNKITFHIQAAMLSDVGDEYQLIATTVHIQGSTPTLPTTHADEAEYDYNPESGASGGENEGTSGGGTNEEGNDYIGFYALGFGLLYLGCGVVWFIIWLLLGFWAYKDAKSRGMSSPILAFILVFLLGLIGLIIYLVIRPKEKKPEIPPPAPPPPT